MKIKSIGGRGFDNTYKKLLRKQSDEIRLHAKELLKAHRFSHIANEVRGEFRIDKLKKFVMLPARRGQ